MRFRLWIGWLSEPSYHASRSQSSKLSKLICPFKKQLMRFVSRLFVRKTEKFLDRAIVRLL